MKLTVIYSAIVNKEQKLNKVVKIITDTMLELGFEDIKVINLAYENIPFYDGTMPRNIERIINDIDESSGVIFATTANRFSCNPLMHSFLEYLYHDLNSRVLEDKNCFITVVSEYGGEQAGTDFISSIIWDLGGFDCGRIMINKNYLDLLENNEDISLIIERQTEDFYRIIRQRRKFFVPTISTQRLRRIKMESNQDPKKKLGKQFNVSGKNKKTATKIKPQEKENTKIPSSELLEIDAMLQKAIEKMPKPEDYPDEFPELTNKSLTSNIIPNKKEEILHEEYIEEDKNDVFYEEDAQPKKVREYLSNEQIERLLGIDDDKKSSTPEELYSKYNLSELDDEQEKDIKEITNFFAQKYVKSENNDTLIDKNKKTTIASFNDNEDDVPKPRERTCKQITQSLPHYYKAIPDFDLNAKFQLNISGARAIDNFNGYLVINGNECSYYDGQLEDVDITIIADADAWLDILKGKNTAQKSFMVGKLKVRGNFLLLSKFDQMFRWDAI